MTTTIDTRARAAVRDLTSYRPGKPIEEVKRELKLASVIKLASNENALGPSPKAVAALKQAVGSLHRYPESTCPILRAKVAKKLRVDPASLIFGNGSDEIIVLALRAFVDPGDEVVVATPTFLIYELQAKACGAEVSVVPLRDYRYDLTAMMKAVTPHTKLVFIANPDNPTGTYVTAKELKMFLGSIPDQTVVFMDEAYYEFVEASDYPQTLSLTEEQSLIITRSFSKAYGLAGLRIGYGIAREGVIAAMEAVREPFNVNSLAQTAAAAALDDTAFLSKTRRLVQEGRSYLTKELDRLSVRYVPSVTNFILLELGPRAQDIARALLSRGVIVREMSAWKLTGHLRVTIGTMPENRRFISALKQCLAQ
ncbi:MAG: histidinol-phosphate transaminase [Candidatus Omnitrophica bacterium]|nr:histidinol-phosphate transaminase [Candidatus Omnitrophota bacterium]